MAFTQEQFDTLISKLEPYAQQQPANYKLRVGLLAVLGYVYIFIILVILLAASLLVLFGFVAFIFYTHTINAMVVKLGVIILGSTTVPILIVLRSLWVKFPPPEGLKLHRQDVPNLFNMVNDLSNSLKVPHFDHILLNDEFNAAVVQRPRLGLLGWQENYLLLGLPLMQALSPAQFSAVIAHELGRLSGNHSRFAGWIYRIQKTYYQILQQLQTTGNEAIFSVFFNWYSPFFAAYSFVLRRMNEYEADKCASQLLGVKNTGEALINVDVKIKLLSNTFWPDIYKQAQELIEPPTQVYTQMSSMLLSNSNNDDSVKFLQQCLAEKTDYQDTHPCLVDRLKSIGYLTENNQELNLPKPFPISAAREYLGNSLSKYIKYFEESWCEKMQTPWRQRYAYAQESLKKLGDLEARTRIDSLNIDENWELAYLTYEFKSEDESIPILQKILNADPNYYGANYLLGQILLQRDDIAGIEYMEKAISQHYRDFVEGCSMIYAFWKKQGNMKAAYSYQDRIDQHYNLLALAKQERSYVNNNDQFQEHNLPEEIVNYLQEILGQRSDVKIAYLTQKVVQYFPEEPFYVLGLQQTWALFEGEDRRTKFINEILNSLSEFPGYIYVILLVDNNKSLEKKMRQIPDAIIYQRTK